MQDLTPLPRPLREVVYVDGVRTAFGKATPDGLFAKTRADDMVVKLVRELLRRQPSLPPERIEVPWSGRANAATMRTLPA